MNIGKLYKVKKYFWLMFPTKQTVAAAHAAAAAAAAYHTVPENTASYWSKQLNCEVTYFSPDSYIVYFEEDGVYKNVLTSEGKIGWTWFGESYNDSFEEVEREEP
jgi:hypothetical protein